MNKKKLGFFTLLFLFFIFLWPKHYWSRFVGYIADQKIPLSLRPTLLKAFVKMFSINMQEAEKSLSEYESFNGVFTRKLKKDARPLSSQDVISPVDSRVLIFGKTKEETMLQVKGKEMSVKTLLLGKQEREEKVENFLQNFVEPFFDGNYLTLYLSPSDYHRIHSPVSGDIIGYSYVPGNFFPVNRPAAYGIKNLFNRNERWTTFIQTTHGKIAVVKVAATSVGRIPVNYEPEQQKIFHKRKTFLHAYTSAKPILKGEELGRFELGSTVILLFEKNCFELFQINQGDKVNYGQAIAVYNK